MDDLQALVDALSLKLDRAVYVDDAHSKPLAASAQVGHIDEARVTAMLARQPTEPHLRYFAQAGVYRTMLPLRVPASRSHGLSARVVVPVTTGTRTLARIWLIDTNPRISDADVKVTQQWADRMSPLVDASVDVDNGRAAVGARMVKAIRRAGQNRRAKILSELGRLRGIDDPRDLRACVIQLTPGPCASHDEVCATITELLDVHRAAGYADGHTLRLLLAPLETGPELAKSLLTTAGNAALLHSSAVAALGISHRLRSVDDVETAFQRAEFCTAVASRLTNFDGAASWDHLGEYKLFAGLDWNRTGIAELHPGVATLVHDHPGPLATTLLLYLDREGDVESTARELHIHRTTLYYRLRRAREIIGDDATGGKQFAIHAALKFSQLIAG